MEKVKEKAKKSKRTIDDVQKLVSFLILGIWNVRKKKKNSQYKSKWCVIYTNMVLNRLSEEFKNYAYQRMISKTLKNLLSQKPLLQGT